MINRHNNSCAVYLAADPLTTSEIEVLKEAKKIYANVDIILDRKSTNSHRLSYSDRSEIIKHDLKSEHITDYNIIPNDSTLIQTLKTNNIRNLVLGVTSSTLADQTFKQIKFMHKIDANLSIVAIPTLTSASLDLIDMLLNEPVSIDLQQKYMSDYAFMKAKLAMVQKIGIVYEDKEKMDIVLKAFSDRQYEFDILDLDLIKAKDTANTIAELIRSSSKRKLVLFSSKLFKSQIDKICDSVVCIYSNKLSPDQAEQMKMSDMYVDATGNDEATQRNAINLINHRLSKSI